MSDKKIKAMIANTFLEVADALETGQYGKKPVIGFASEGSEHGQDNIEEAMKIAEMKGLKAVLIEGEDLHKKMEEMLDSGEIDGAVTMHYPFPIGVSTVGKVVPQARESLCILPPPQVRPTQTVSAAWLRTQSMESLQQRQTVWRTQP